MKSNNIKPVQKKKTHMPMGARIAFGAMAAVAGMSSASCENPTEVIEVRPRPEFHQVFWINSNISDRNKNLLKEVYNSMTDKEVIELKDDYRTIFINSYANIDELTDTFYRDHFVFGIYGEPDNFVGNFKDLIEDFKKEPYNQLSALGRKLDSAKQTVRLSMGKMRQGRMI